MTNSVLEQKNAHRFSQGIFILYAYLSSHLHGNCTPKPRLNIVLNVCNKNRSLQARQNIQGTPKKKDRVYQLGEKGKSSMT